MLKCDLHLHTNRTTKHISHDPEKLIDYMAKKKYQVISITDLNHYTYNDQLARYAKKKGILLIPGIELRLQGKDVLVYNATKHDLEGVRSLEDLYSIRKDSVLIIAPHPFFIFHRCLGKSLIEHIDLFDAVEYSHFYTRIINPNKTGVTVSKRYEKPMIGGSDAHILDQVGTTYSLLDARPSVKSIVDSIKKGNLQLKTKPLPVQILAKIIIFWFRRVIFIK